MDAKTFEPSRLSRRSLLSRAGRGGYQASLTMTNAGAVLPEVGHRFIESNGIRMHLAEQGQGPLVILLHPFPVW
jgi:hypothetical protein